MTGAITYNYLHWVSLSNLINWSVGYLLETEPGYNNKYPLAPMSVFLSRNKTSIDIQDHVLYTRVTIRTSGMGVTVRDKLLGEKIGTKKQFIIHSGQFLISKIDARNGAFGVVPDEADDAVITGNFWTFDVDTSKINPAYLTLLTSTKQFVSFAEKASNGTTNRHYLQENLFLAAKIPLPTLEEQNKIIAAYNSTLAQAKRLYEQAQEIEEQIENYWHDILGVATRQREKVQTDKYRYLKFTDFYDLSEWGIDIIQNKQKREIFKYPIKKIKTLCQLGSGGTPSRSNPRYYKGSIPWVKTGEVVNDEIFETEEHITEEAISNSSAKVYPKGSLIIAMYGQGDTRGRTAKLGVDSTTNQACAVLYNIDNSFVTTDYLWYYLQSRYHDLRSMASGNNQPNLNAGKINNYTVVLPPIDIQKKIVIHIQEQKAQIKRLKQQAETLRKDALVEFEKAIFE